MLEKQNAKFEFEKKEVVRKQEIKINEQVKQMQETTATQEQILEFNNTRLVKEKEL